MGSFASHGLSRLLGAQPEVLLVRHSCSGVGLLGLVHPLPEGGCSCLRGITALMRQGYAVGRIRLSVGITLQRMLRVHQGLWSAYWFCSLTAGVVRYPVYGHIRDIKIGGRSVGSTWMSST